MNTATAINRRFLSLGFFLLICYAASAAGGLVTYPSIGDWYQNLQKPSWTPPAALLGPVWTVLYVMIAIAAWLVWDRFHGGSFPALKLFGYQLGLSVLWSILFFGLRNPDLAAAEIVVHWLLLAATTLAFYRLHRFAGFLLIPYLAWVTFAVFLNFSVANQN
jgi:benzodiazapine receptor